MLTAASKEKLSTPNGSSSRHSPPATAGYPILQSKQKRRTSAPTDQPQLPIQYRLIGGRLDKRRYRATYIVGADVWCDYHYCVDTEVVENERLSSAKKRREAIRLFLRPRT